MTNDHHYTSCVILGAGLVGSLIALRLFKAGIDVIVIEARDFHRTSPFEDDARTTAVSYGSARILKEAGIWRELLPYTCPVKTIKVFESGTPYSLVFKEEDITYRPGEAMGYMISNTLLRTHFRKTLLSREDLKVIDNATVTSFVKETSHIRLTLSNGQTILASLVIGAEGRHSPSRDEFGISISKKEYDQTALVATVSHARPHENVAYEVFDVEGPLAFLPMKDAEDIMFQSAIVWSSKLNLKALSNVALEEKLNRLFPLLGELKLVSQPMFYPLSFQKTSSLTAHRFALVGDAAHTMHPVAGQGVNLGWRDAKVLSDMVIHYHSLGLDIGSKTLLDAYAWDRYKDQKPLMLVSHNLIKLFGVDSQCLKVFRSYGLGLVNLVPPLKRFLMKKAMGI